MTALVGQELVHGTDWKIGDLLEPRVFGEGVAALAQADVIVISLYEAERLPATFYLWVNVWLQITLWAAGSVGRPRAVPPEEVTFGANE